MAPGGVRALGQSPAHRGQVDLLLLGDQRQEIAGPLEQALTQRGGDRRAAVVDPDLR